MSAPRAPSAAGGATTSAIYHGTVTHARGPADGTAGGPAHAFTQRTASVLLDLDDLPALDRRLRLFGWNRPAPFGFRDTDHLGEPALPPRRRVRAFLEAHGVEPPDGRILLHANLRFAGYVFDPISIWWCRDADDVTQVVIAEVHNTFGERHSYVLRPERDQRGRLHATAEKRLHVSPFFAVDGSYRFRLSEPGEELSLRVDGHGPDGARRFRAVHAARRIEPLGDGALLRLALCYPFVPQRVTAGIHWQAARLLVKGARFHRKPAFTPGEGSIAEAAR